MPQITDEATLRAMRRKNNPEGKPVGHYTGRCAYCHSSNLWDDCTAYGCKDCGALFMTGELIPVLIPNENRR